MGCLQCVQYSIVLRLSGVSWIDIPLLNVTGRWSRNKNKKLKQNLHGIQKRFQGQIWRHAVKVDCHHALNGIDQHRWRVLELDRETFAKPILYLTICGQSKDHTDTDNLVYSWKRSEVQSRRLGVRSWGLDSHDTSSYPDSISTPGFPCCPHLLFL